jgi:hypothetical protein
MPITYRIDHERRMVIARGYGTFTDDDVFNYQRAAWSGRDVVGYDELVDMSYVSEIELPSVQLVQDLASVAAHMDLQSAPTRFAIVAPEDLAFGLGRMFQTYRECEERSIKDVKVFRNFGEALAFLKIKEALPPSPPGVATEEQ